MKQKLIPFCISLIVLLLLIHPVIFLNDEWITTNQLAQLSEHHQILYNEGKYGTYSNGTPYDYFIERENLLSYTSFLPILAYPFLMVVKITGDILPYYASIIFTLLLLVLALIIKERFSTTIGPVLLIGIAFAALLLNIIFYRPFQVTTENAPVEILAVVLTHIFVFIMLVLVIHAIMKTLFSDPAFATFGLLASIACSSYLIWMTTCKDHLDVALIIAFLLFFLVRFVKTDDVWYLFSGFLAVGILTWVRPELGSVFFVTMLIITILHIFFIRSEKRILSYLCYLLTPFGTAIGMIPLFLSNFYVTGNPLTFPFQLITKASQLHYITAPSTTPLPGNFLLNTINITGIPDMASSVLFLMGTRIIPGVPVDTFLSNLYAVLISPTTLKVPIIALVPLLIIGLFFLPAVIRSRGDYFKLGEKRIIVYLLVLVLGTFCAYLVSIGGLHTSVGIYPDIRYLSPVYLPLTLIGLIILSHVLTDSAMIQRVLKCSSIIALVCCCIMPFVLGGLYRLYDFWDIFLWTNGIVTTTIYCLLFLCLFLVFGWYRGIIRLPVLTLPIAFLIAVPLVWQVTMVMLTNFSIGDPYHYPPLLPMMRELFAWLQG